MIVFKSSITKVEATVVQPMPIAVTDKRAVIVYRCLFLLLFWTSPSERIHPGGQKSNCKKNIAFRYKQDYAHTTITIKLPNPINFN